MFDYFRIYSSNPHQVCCEDSLTKDLFFFSQFDDLALHSRSQLHLKRDKCLTGTVIAISRTVFKLCIQTWCDGRLRHGIYAHARFHDLDLDAKSQWVGQKIRDSS